MKSDRENIKKLKALCEELSDRDDQLKVNASTLWMILEKVQMIKENLSCLKPVCKDTQGALASSVSELDEISDIVSNRGCKKVQKGDKS